MAIITITSDWGQKDHYTGAVKGGILTMMPEATIVDITHEIAPFDIQAASFVISNCYKNFPKGSIHIIGINTEASIETPHIAALYNGHYFIGADNGIFSLICNSKPDKIIELNIPQESDYFTFSARDVFVKVAVMIAKGEAIESMGIKKDFFKEALNLQPVIEANTIKGNIIYVDSYENVVTNISRELFREAGKNRKFVITFRSGYEIDRISEAYNDVDEGEKLALFGSTGNLEIAINMGNASSLLGIKTRDFVRIEFE